MGQWPIMVTTDGNKMHQNVAFPGIKFQNFLGRCHSPLPTAPHHTAAFLGVWGVKAGMVCVWVKGKTV